MQPRRPTIPRANNTHLTPLEIVLLAPTLSAVWLTRAHFGFYIMNVGSYVLSALAFWSFHDVIGGLLGWGDPGFLHGFAGWFFLAGLPFAVWHYIEARRAWNRREDRMSVYLGEPHLMRLGIPRTLAMVLDALLIGVAGWFLRHVDHALGLWLLWGGFFSLVIVACGTAQQRDDSVALHDASIYARVVQRQTGRPLGRAQRGGTQDVSTGSARR